MYLIMELCSHGELEDLLAEKKFFSEKVGSSFIGMSDMNFC